MYYVIKFYLKHYQASRSSYRSRKVRRISSKNARFCPFFLFSQPFLIRVGPVINMFRLRNISTYYFKCFRVCGTGYYGRARVRKTPRGSYFGNSRTKKTSLSPIYMRKWIAWCRLIWASTGLILVSDKRSDYVLCDKILFEPLPSS